MDVNIDEPVPIDEHRTRNTTGGLPELSSRFNLGPVLSPDRVNAPEGWRPLNCLSKSIQFYRMRAVLTDRRVITRKNRRVEL